jgi:hypothetical protein
MSETKFHNPYYVRWVPGHHGMSRPQDVDGGDGLQVWRVAASILSFTLYENAYLKSILILTFHPPVKYSEKALPFRFSD